MDFFHLIGLPENFDVVNNDPIEYVVNNCGLKIKFLFNDTNVKYNFKKCEYKNDCWNTSYLYNIPDNEHSPANTRFPFNVNNINILIEYNDKFNINYKTTLNKCSFNLNNDNVLTTFFCKRISYICI